MMVQNFLNVYLSSGTLHGIQPVQVLTNQLAKKRTFGFFDFWFGSNRLDSGQKLAVYDFFGIH